MPLTPRRKRANTAFRGERGFTLVELLVAMAGGIVVASALFTILDVTLRETTRTFSRVDATQRARTALETIGNQMRSGCVENRVVPIHEGSTGTSVSYWSAYGNSVSVTPEKHTIAYDSGSGKLIDTTYPVSGGFAPNWQASPTPSRTNTLLTNVAPVPGVPIFQYYSLEPGAPSPLPAPLPSGLSEADSERTTEVRMTLVVRPAGGTQQNTNVTPNTVTNTAVLRLTPIPSPGTPNQSYRPCE